MAIFADFHIHTSYSIRTFPYEGLSTVKEVISQARKVGLNCIAKTDHDTIKGNKEAITYGKKVGVIVVPGVEISKRYDKEERRAGIKRKKEEHIIGLGINSKLPNNINKRSIEEIADWIHDNSGIAVASHPFNYDGMGNKISLNCIDVIEIHNANNIDRISNFRAKLAAKELNKPGIAGSDAHWHKLLGIVVNKIDNGSSTDEILEKIINGNNRILKGGYNTLNQIYEWQLERYKKNFNEVSEYINKNFHGMKRGLLLYLLNSSVDENTGTKIFWKTLMPLVYSYIVVKNFCALAKDFVI